MSRGYNGGVIGAKRTANSTLATGMWNLDGQRHAKLSTAWPTPPMSVVVADAAYDAQGWVSANTDYVGTTGAFQLSKSGINNNSGGARSSYLPYASGLKVYFEIYINNIGNGEMLIGLAGDATGAGYGTVPCIYMYNGGPYGGYPSAVSGAFITGDTINFAYDVDTNKMYIGRNGTWSVNPTSGSGGTIPSVTAGSAKPRVCFMSGSSSGATMTGTFRWATASFTGSIPSGYAALNTIPP